MNIIRLLQGDCLDRMKEIPDGSVDAIITDPPYGTTKIAWDNIIDFNLMWEQILRILKPNGACVLFSSQPFTSNLIMSNPSYFKYQLIWRKNKIQHFAQAPYRFLTEHEEILIFSKAGTAKNARVVMKYNPQDLVACDKKVKGKKADSAHRMRKTDQKDYKQTKTGYPKSILEFKSESKPMHPTQKPVALLEYLVKTYTNESDTVLDFTMGSGSTGVACMNTNRNFIGIELDKEYFKIAEKRIEQANIDI